MDSFYHPYTGFQDAAARLGRFVDTKFGPGYGLTWSDGMSVWPIKPRRSTSPPGVSAT